MSVALCLGLIGLTVLWWNSSLPHEVVAPSVPRYINTILGFVLLLLLVGSIKNSERDQNIAENLKSISLCDILTENKTFVFAAAWSLLCCGVLMALVLVPWVSLVTLGQQNVLHLSAIVTNANVGIILPLALICLLKLRRKEENEIKTVGISV